MIGVGVGVEAALEVGHHEDPAGEHQELRAARVGERFRAPFELGGRHARDRAEPLRIARAPTEEHGDALGGEGVHRAQRPRQPAVDLGEVGAVAELVQHRLHPPFGRGDVAEHADVALAVDVDAERVLVLALRG